MALVSQEPGSTGRRRMPMIGWPTPEALGHAPPAAQGQSPRPAAQPPSAPTFSRD